MLYIVLFGEGTRCILMYPHLKMLFYSFIHFRGVPIPGLRKKTKQKENKSLIFHTDYYLIIFIYCSLFIFLLLVIDESDGS